MMDPQGISLLFYAYINSLSLSNDVGGINIVMVMLFSATSPGFILLPQSAQVFSVPAPPRTFDLSSIAQGQGPTKGICAGSCTCLHPCALNSKQEASWTRGVEDCHI